MNARPASAALVLAFASLLFSFMALLAKAASARLPGAEVAFVRFLFGVAACAAVAVRRGMQARNRRGLALRGLFGGVAVLLFFLTIEHLPVGVATLLNYTSPVFTAIWAALFLREPLEASSVVALLLATCGVTLVSLGTQGAGDFAFGYWVLIGACGAVFSGAAVAVIREVRKTDGAWEVFAAFCIAGAAITAVPALRGWVAPERREWALLVGVGVTALLAQMAFTWALRYVRAAPAGILQQLTPVGALELGRVVYGDRISLLSALGTALALTGVSVGAWRIARPQPVAAEDV